MILARAAHLEGWHVQVFPEFGVERRGVPVSAFARLDRAPIRVRSKVYRPDHVLVLDAGIMGVVDITSGLKENGWIIINSPKPPSSFEVAGVYQVATVDGSSVAARHKIGTETAPIVNTTMVGAFARATGLVSLDAVGAAIVQTLGGSRSESNIAAAREAFGMLTLSMTLLHEALMRKDDAHGRGDV
jgi:2-oxoacid:acceptor oxidoreductase gamma subunit (pyruvate/2-ketoisovalerate family)